MNKTLLILTLLFSTLSFSQEIKLEKGKFYTNGEQISSRDAKILLASNLKAAKLFKSSKNKESIGGFLIGFGSALIVGDLVKGLVSDEVYPSTMTYVGLGSLAVSIPILSGRKKKMEEAISIYNSELKSNGFNQNYQLDFVSNQNGFGLKITF